MFQLERNFANACAGFIKLDEAGTQAGARISPLCVGIRARDPSSFTQSVRTEQLSNSSLGTGGLASLPEAQETPEGAHATGR